ncbi:MFS transporter [Saccharopolyspora erythraea]|uniref:MFS transporter n=1 Tax=Saccharopolyspora erythraea TaxID=1836 RepID=UPI001BA79A21|nr:MFS transporter [Saccharopolyspora erythraea]QUH01946.1 MFS transporter [Saccharopolyspora erythraea]
MTPVDLPAPKRAQTVAAMVLSLPLGVVTGAVGAALPLLREDYGLSPTGGAELVVLYNAGAFAALVALGGSWTRRALPAVLTALVVVFAFCCAGMAFAGAVAGPGVGWPLMLALATGAGFGYGGLVLQLNSFVGESFGHRQVLMLNLLHASFGAGAVAGPLFMGALGGVSAVLAAAGGLAALCLPVRRIALPQPAAETLAPRSSPVALLAMFAGISLLYAGLESAIAASASTHLAAVGYPAADATALVGLFWAGLTAGRLVVPAVARGWSSHRLVLTGVLSGTAALISTVLPTWAPVGYALAGLGFSVVFPAVLAWAFTALGDGQRVASLLLVANLAGSAALPAAVAAASGSAPATIPAALTGLAVLCGIAILLPLRCTRTKTDPNPKHWNGKPHERTTPLPAAGDRPDVGAVEDQAAGERA